MNLEQMTAKVRPRKGWEAIDLGVALVQKNAFDLYKIWLLVTLPIFLLSALVFNEYAIWQVFIFWLLKPFWERPLLHFISRELFNEKLTVKQCASQFFSLAKIQWFASVSWRRLSLTRSLDLPIIQLEGLSGSNRTQRLRVIHSIGSGPAVWLTLFFMSLETIFYFSMFALAYLLLPQQYSESIDIWKWFTNDGSSLQMDFLLNLMAYLSVSLVAPFYTACGFALYINQRTHLEAWDIELAFKRLAKRLSKENEYHPVKLASWLIAISLLVVLMVPAPVSAEIDLATEITELLPKTNELIDSDGEQISETAETIQQDSALLNHQQAKALIDTVVQDEKFSYKEMDYEFRLVIDEDEDDKLEMNSFGRSPIWNWIGRFIAWIVEFVLWIVIGLLILFLVLRYRHLISGAKSPQSKAKHRPKMLFGLDVQTDSLPKKPWAVALSLVEKQQYREALSLLYRASLVWYIDHSDIRIKEGDTELECLAKILAIKFDAGSVDGTQVFMRELTTSWRALAYAHQQPAHQQLNEFCQQWPTLFIATQQEAVNGR